MNNSPSSAHETEHESQCQSGNASYRHIWKYYEIIKLIDSMGNHMNDFDHPRKRKHVLELVANDMISDNHHISALMVQSKWHSLLRSYKKAKDNATASGHLQPLTRTSKKIPGFRQELIEKKLKLREEKLQIERQKLAIEERKLFLLEKYLDSKYA